MFRTQPTFLVVLATILSITLSSCEKQSTYASYEDCMLDNVTSSQTEAAVVAIHEACRNKYPEPPLTVEELKALQTASDAADAAATQSAMEMARIEKESAATVAAAQASADAAMAAYNAAGTESE